MQQIRYEAERAFAQYDQADPNNRLVVDVLEQRWNAKLQEQRHLERELDELGAATAALSRTEELAIRALGEDFATVWNDPQCPMPLKKRIARTLIKEIVADLVGPLLRCTADLGHQLAQPKQIIDAEQRATRRQLHERIDAAKARPASR